MGENLMVSALDRAVKTQDIVTGPSNLAGLASTYLTDDFTSYLKNRFKVSSAYDETQKEHILEFIGSSPVNLNIISYSIMHFEARVASRFLEHLLYFKHNFNRSKILLLGCNLKQYRTITKLFNEAIVHGVLSRFSDRDNERFQDGLTWANSHKTTPLQVGDPVADAYLDVYDYCLSDVVYSNAYFTVLNDYQQFNFSNWDFCIAFDSLYDISPESLGDLCDRLQIKSVFFTLHMIPEMFLWNGKTDYELHNRFFECKWTKTMQSDRTYRVLMQFKDMSSPYSSKAKYIGAWSKSKFTRNWRWDPVYFKLGYGLFTFTRRSPTIKYEPAQPYYGLVSELLLGFDVNEFVKFGRIKVLFFQRSKYNLVFQYFLNAVTNKEAIEVNKLMTMIRGALGKIQLGATSISGNWELYNADFLDIVTFILLDITVHRARLNESFSSNLRFMKESNSVLESFKGWFIKRYNRIVKLVKKLFNCKDAYDFVQDFKRIDVRLDTTLGYGVTTQIVHKFHLGHSFLTKTFCAQDLINLVRAFPDKIGGIWPEQHIHGVCPCTACSRFPKPADYDEIKARYNAQVEAFWIYVSKYSKRHCPKYSTGEISHAVPKVEELLDCVKRNQTLVHYGVEPGAMAVSLAKMGFRRVVAVQIKQSTEGFFKTKFVMPPSIEVIEADEILGCSLPKKSLIFSDASHCNKPSCYRCLLIMVDLIKQAKEFNCSLLMKTNLTPDMWLGVSDFSYLYARRLRSTSALSTEVFIYYTNKLLHLKPFVLLKTPLTTQSDFGTKLNTRRTLALYTVFYGSWLKFMDHCNKIETLENEPALPVSKAPPPAAPVVADDDDSGDDEPDPDLLFMDEDPTSSMPAPSAPPVVPSAPDFGPADVEPMFEPAADLGFDLTPVIFPGGAGVFPYVEVEGVNYLLIVLTSDGWATYGGSTDRTDVTMQDAAIREFEEEFGELIPPEWKFQIYAATPVMPYNYPVKLGVKDHADLEEMRVALNRRYNTTPSEVKEVAFMSIDDMFLALTGLGGDIDQMLRGVWRPFFRKQLLKVSTQKSMIRFLSSELIELIRLQPNGPDILAPRIRPVPPPKGPGVGGSPAPEVSPELARPIPPPKPAHLVASVPKVKPPLPPKPVKVLGAAAPQVPKKPLPELPVRSAPRAVAPKPLPAVPNTVHQASSPLDPDAVDLAVKTVEMKEKLKNSKRFKITRRGLKPNSSDVFRPLQTYDLTDVDNHFHRFFFKGNKNLPGSQTLNYFDLKTPSGGSLQMVMPESGVFPYTLHNGSIALLDLPTPGAKSTMKRWHPIEVEANGGCVWLSYAASREMAMNDLPLLSQNIDWSVSWKAIAMTMGCQPIIVKLKDTKDTWWWLVPKAMTQTGYPFIDCERDKNHMNFLAHPNNPSYSSTPSFPTWAEISSLAIRVNFSVTPKEADVISRAVFADTSENYDDPDVQSAMAVIKKKFGTKFDMSAIRARFDGALRSTLCFLADCVPGAGKTYFFASIAASLMDVNKPETCKRFAYLVGTVASLTEFQDALVDMLIRDGRWSRQALNDLNSTYIREYNKTFVVGYTLSDPNVRLVMIDECFRFPFYSIATYVHAFKNALFLFAGDSNQIEVHDGWFPNFKMNTGGRMKFTLKSFLTEAGFFKKGCSAYFRNNVTRRFPVDPIYMLRCLGIKAAESMKTCVIAPFSLRVTEDNGDIWLNVPKESSIVMQFTKNDQISSARPVSVVGAQGASKNAAYLYWGELSMNQQPDILVGLTRAKRFMTIVFPAKTSQDYGKLRKALAEVTVNHKAAANARSKLKADASSARQAKIDEMVGGAFKPAGADYGVGRLQPKNPFKGGLDYEFAKELASKRPFHEYYSSYYKRNQKIHRERTSVGFRNADFIALDPNWNQLNTQQASMVYATEEYVGHKLYFEKLTLNDYELRTVSSVAYGKRHYRKSAFQTWNTFMNRAAKSREYQAAARRRVSVYGDSKFIDLAESLGSEFFDLYVDKTKYESLMNSVILDDILQATWIEFCHAVKWNEPQNENIVGYALRSMQGFLKQQIKPKGIDAPLKRKPGQSVSGVAKLDSLLYGPLFRFQTRCLLMCLKPNWMVGMNCTAQDIADWHAKFQPIIKKIISMDATEYDTEQNEFTKLLVMTVFLMFTNDVERLKMYYASRGMAMIHTLVCSFFWGHGMPSGATDTLIGNVILMMIITMMLFKKNERVSAIFLGDDSGNCFNVESPQVDPTFFNLLFTNPLKVTETTDILDFCNHLFRDGVYVYNPQVLAMKIINKEYTNVLTSEQNWNEYTDSLHIVLNSYYKSRVVVIKLIQDFFNLSFYQAEFMMTTIHSFASMSYRQALRQLKPDTYVVNDYVGGVRFKHNSHKQNSPDYKYQMSVESNAKGKVLEIVAQRGLAAPKLTPTGMSGPAHAPLYTASAQWEVQGVTIYSEKWTSSTKKQLEQCIYAELLRKFNECKPSAPKPEKEDVSDLISEWDNLVELLDSQSEAKEIASTILDEMSRVCTVVRDPTAKHECLTSLFRVLYTTSLLAVSGGPASHNKSSYAKTLAELRNRMMHALNGNGQKKFISGVVTEKNAPKDKPKKQRKVKAKEIANEVKKEVKKEEAAVQKAVHVMEKVKPLPKREFAPRKPRMSPKATDDSVITNPKTDKQKFLACFTAPGIAMPVVLPAEVGATPNTAKAINWQETDDWHNTMTVDLPTDSLMKFGTDLTVIRRQISNCILKYEINPADYVANPTIKDFIAFKKQKRSWDKQLEVAKIQGKDALNSFVKLVPEPVEPTPSVPARRSAVYDGWFSAGLDANGEMNPASLVWNPNLDDKINGRTQLVPLSHMRFNPDLSDTSGWKPHGEFFPVGKSTRTNAEGKFFWMNKGDVLKCEVQYWGTAGVTASFILDQLTVNGVETLDEELLQFVSTLGQTSQDASVPSPGNGYFRIRCLFGDSDTNSFILTHFTLTIGGSCLRHITPPGLLQETGRMGKVTVQGIGFLHQNASSKLYKGGTQLAAVLPKDYNAQLLFAEADKPSFLSSLSQNSGGNHELFEQGAYVTVPPTEDVFHATTEFVLAKNGELADCQYSIDGPKDAVALYIDVKAATILSGVNGKVKYGISYQYESFSMYDFRWKPKHDIQKLRQALNKAADFPILHDNPTHIKDIVNFVTNGLKSGAEIAEKYGPLVAGLAAMVGI